MRIGIISLIGWDTLHQRPQKFAEELAARGHTVYYVEPTDYQIDPTNPVMLFNSVRRRLPYYRQVAPAIYALRPALVPLFRHFAAYRSLNRWLAPIAIGQLRRLRLDFAIVLTPEYAPVVARLGVPFAYDHVDDTQFMDHIDTERYVRAMQRLMRGSAFNIYIQDAAACADPKGICIANGVDLDQFFPVDAPRSFDAVVLSSIGKWFDMEAVLASERQILLIGPMDFDGGNNRARFLAAARPNLGWIPQVEKAVANFWLSRAEVGLVPFDYRHPVTRYAMPLKILEYFLAGLPVVTYRNEGISRQYGDLVTYYAHDGSEPLGLDAAIAAAKARRGAHDYRAFAARFQWRDLVGDLERHIRRAVEAHAGGGR